MSDSSFQLASGPSHDLVASFDDELLEGMKQTGFHPFVMVRLIDENTSTRELLICPNPQDIQSFVDQVSAVEWFGESKLLQAIVRALLFEPYEAAELFFEWTQQTESTVSETAYVGLADGSQCPMFYQYPAFEIKRCVRRSDSQCRIQALSEIFAAYEDADGCDGLRFAIIEALAFGISKALAGSSRYAAALAFVERGLSVSSGSIHLKASKHALCLRLEGKKVPPRLEKFLGADNGYLKKFVCPEPFERLDIGPTGEALVCTGLWCPTIIGNFMKDPIESIINSEAAQKIRQSVTDGSYRYCNHLECGPLIQDALPDREDHWSVRARAGFEQQEFKVDGVDKLIFAFDQSCNLSCPSCRRDVFMDRQIEDKERAIETNLPPLLPKLKTLMINTSGELFASKLSRNILDMINDEVCPHLSLNIITNATLFDEAQWMKFPQLHNRVKSLRISVDAAHKETFETLRRPGKYDVFLENVRFIQQLRTSQVIGELKFSFTYQIGNFREMRDFIEFCESMSADMVIFERLLNLGAFKDDEHIDRAVHKPNHPMNSEFMDIIKDPIFRQPNIWHDFDYPGVENMTHEEVAVRVRKRGAVVSG